MKRVVLLLIILTLVLSGCSSKQKKELELAISKTNALSNYAIDVVVEYDGSIFNTTRFEVDGDHFTYSIEDVTDHYYMVDNEMYHLFDKWGFPTLMKLGTVEGLFNDVYVIGNGEEITSNVSMEDDLYILDSPEEWEDFEEWEDEVKKITFSLKDGYIYQIIIQFESRGLLGVVTKTFTDIDSVVLEEMDYITIDEYDQIKAYELLLDIHLENANVNVYNFFSSDFSIKISCDSDDLCLITMNQFGDTYEYNVNTKEVSNMQTSEVKEISDFLTTCSYNRINQTLFDFIDLIEAFHEKTFEE